MKVTLKVKLAPSPEQHSALLGTMERFNAACDFIAQVAFDNPLASKFKLQKLVYFDVKERFDLTSQIVIRDTTKMVKAYKCDKAIRCRFRQHGAIVYDERIMSFRGLEAVNLWTAAEDHRQTIPMILGGYQRTPFGGIRAAVNRRSVRSMLKLTMFITLDLQAVAFREW